MASRTCDTCGSPFEARDRKDRPNRFCSPECYRASATHPLRNRPAKGQRMREVPGHPIAPPSGFVAVSRLVLYDKIGPGTHQCHWCGRSITWQAGGGPATIGNLLADHLNWDRQDDRPENLVPSCNHCNAHRTARGERAPLTSEDLTVVWSGIRTRAIARTCETCSEKFLIPPSATKRGRGRFCSRSCARRAPRT